MNQKSSTKIACWVSFLLIFALSASSIVQALSVPQTKVSQTQSQSQDDQKQQAATNCSPNFCSSNEFAFILRRIVQNEDILKRFREMESLSGGKKEANVSLSISFDAGSNIRPHCVRELLDLIKNLASNELELKTMLEFASDQSSPSVPAATIPATPTSFAIKPKPDQISQNRSGSTGDGLFKFRRLLSLGRTNANGSAKMMRLDFSQLKLLNIQGKSILASRDNCNANEAQSASAGNPEVDQIHPEQEKSSLRTLNKFVSSVDNWINAIERFTLTREWSSLMKVFEGSESILNMFVAKTSPATQTGGTGTGTNQTKMIENLQLNLPNQVQILTNSLNSLFPWHVWPWNNLDLYSTIDTFLNHGIFAFGKTTSGPERRIDFLPNMLQTLFKSFKFDSFPKKCTDWSKIICNFNSFHDRLVLEPSSLEQTNSTERELKLKEFVSSGKNLLTQELTCIMFSSLSMQHFGAAKEEVEAPKRMLLPDQTNLLAWNKQVEKALKLYTLSREALSDQQWLKLYNLINDLWSQQKVSDRVIMVGRVIQLITNCHMPKEMLESALWKDIYKYKNFLNQLVDIVTEELTRSSENGKLTIEQISFGSQNFTFILNKFIKLLPKLINALSETIVDKLPELVNRFFNEKAAFFKAPCKGYSFSYLIPSLQKYHEQIFEIEEAICQQFKIKPNITMMQINNLTNDFLMAFNLSSFGNALALPKLLVEDKSSNEKEKLQNVPNEDNVKSSEAGNNVTSIIDEMAANPRLAQIVAILQSSALDPPEVHAELPELDWVEASTSIALLYESIQKLLSYEDVFVIFPEIEGFQEEMKKQVFTSQQMFTKFSKRDPLRLIAYGLDAIMPIALRTYKPMDSFHAECLSSFRDIFSEDLDGKASRQWQCFVSSMNFASWAINNFMKTFNSMFKNVLDHKSNDLNLRTFNRETNFSSANNSNSCIFFDGSVSMMLDNLPQFIDLALETVLMASTTSNQQLTLYDIMCSSNYVLDPFNERSIELKSQMKDKMCHLFHKKSLANCASVLKLEQWTLTMRELNNTWFESNALSITPSFIDITINTHEFLELFGQFKPSTMSDSLIARVLNVNSFWTNLMNRIMSIIDKYQEKRFEYALQTLAPIIYDNLPIEENNNSTKETRELLITTILGAKTILTFLDRQSTNGTIISSQSDSSAQIQSLFDWADQYSMTVAEVLLKTMANNLTKLELIFESEKSNKSRLSIDDVWFKFCSNPVDKYLDIDFHNWTTVFDNSTTMKELNLFHNQLNEGKEVICKFEWKSFYNRLSETENSNKILSDYQERQLTRIALTKWGQVLDVMFIESKHIKNLPKFFYMDYWKQFREKLPQISPLKDQPSNLVWIWRGFERIVNAMDAGTNQTSNSLVRILDQLNCGLDAVKGGLSWENIANIYSDKQDILAAHSTINNGFALASIGVNTFLTHKKFQKFLDELIKPRVGFNAFCDMRERNQLETIFSIPSGQDFLIALESFQELICDTNFEILAQNINPISVCYQAQVSSGNNNGSRNSITDPLSDVMDRFFKLASLAILDAKLVAASDAKPPILDKNQWSTFWNWWSDQAEPQLKSGVALSLVRAFQTIDSINSNHVVWKALFRSVHEISEVAAYLLRAVEKKHQDVDMIGSKLSLVKEAASQLDTAFKNSTTGSTTIKQQQQLASTLSNIMFPEVNNFISFRTFKQLRYIKTITDYFTSTPEAQELICKLLAETTIKSTTNNFERSDGILNSRIELLAYKLNTNEKLYSLLCHYHSSQWLTALNIVISTKTSSIPKKVNYMTKYLSIFTRNYKNNDDLESFIHSQQLENIENVANTTISYLLATSQSIKSLSFTKISNISWHSLPNLLDSIDRHLCASRYEIGTFKIPIYEPKKPELETLVCKLPQWNITQVYTYLSENFDLQNMISLISQQHSNNSTDSTINNNNNNNSNILVTGGDKNNATIISMQKGDNIKVCVTPFKFASRWLKIGQETVDEFTSKISRDKIRKCLNQSKKGQSIYSHALRYVKYVNSLLSSVNNLTGNNSWHIVKKTWASISYLILNQNSPSYISRLY